MRCQISKFSKPPIQIVIYSTFIRRNTMEYRTFSILTLLALLLVSVVPLVA